MTTVPSLNIDKTTPAAIVWQWNNSTCSLAEPDPQIKSITLTTRFDTTCASFQLNVPIRLKGIKTPSSIVLRILPSSIASFDFVPSTTVPETVRAKFDLAIYCLNFELDQRLEILVPADAHEPLSPTRAHSGTVLDAIRQLANVNALSVYIGASALSNAHLQSISDAIRRRLLPSFRDDLASMYGGIGAKIITLPVHPEHLPPPSYDETEPPPPSAPIFDRKRRRKDSRDERDEDIALIWGQLEMIQERYEQRVRALQGENDDLKEEIRSLRELVSTILKGQKDLREEFEALEATTESRLAGLEEEMGTKIVELGEDIQGLAAEVDYIKEHEEDELVDKAKDRVLDHIRTCLSGD